MVHWSLSLSLALVLWGSPVVVEGHGTMLTPIPRQPESVYWYQVGCMIGCECSGGGKEDYPSLESVECIDPAIPTNTDSDSLTYNANGMSPRGAWNQHMPWRAPGTSKPIDSCGIASGFRPEAAVQYPHKFSASSGIQQGQRGTELQPGPITQWEAGSIVDLSFYLVVNHGGGYQYRVCPKDGSNMDESCFEQNPLVFADGFHTVFHGDRKIKIPATDVSDGVIPEGYSWRRIPLPACNCDSGANCAQMSDRDFDLSYDPTSTKPYGSCPTGLQFVPPHIADGSWPEGYGYYVSTLLASSRKDESKNGAFSGNSKSPCASHLESNECTADTENSCQWYPEKEVCFETRNGSSAGSKEGDSGNCADHTDEASCKAGTQNGEECTWYDSPSKTVCYYAGAVGKNSKEDVYSEEVNVSKSDDRNEGEWHITDRVYAPSDPGEYILQWRWDNEQTPQIWTTCADIEVVPEGTPIKPTTTETGNNSSKNDEKDGSKDGGNDGSSGANVSPNHSLVVSSMLFFLTLYIHM